MMQLWARCIKSVYCRRDTRQIFGMAHVHKDLWSAERIKPSHVRWRKHKYKEGPKIKKKTIESIKYLCDTFDLSREDKSITTSHNNYRLSCRRQLRRCSFSCGWCWYFCTVDICLGTRHKPPRPRFHPRSQNREPTRRRC
jgi:hypothetical protein